MLEPHGLAVSQFGSDDVKVLKMVENDLLFIQKELQALLRLQCAIPASASLAESINNALLSKMQAAERQRADPVQILHAFSNRARVEKKPINVATLDECSGVWPVGRLRFGERTLATLRKITENAEFC